MTAVAVDDHGAASHVHIGRQPIWDGDRIYAYELLFRSDADARVLGILIGVVRKC